jgi:predicted alpha/beta-fold hydrolase
VSDLVNRGIKQIALIGFSLGGNVVLRYLGEQGNRLPRPVCGAGAVSVPCDLASSARRMENGDNRIYLIHFLRSLRKKVVEKALRKPGKLSPRRLRGIRTFREFDDIYTAPAHGFRDAEDYWRRCRSLSVLHRIRIPTLLINARDDPFLAPASFPYREASRHPYLYLETPRSGGHVGFVTLPFPNRFWHEARLVSFLDSPSVGGRRRLLSY